MKTFIASLTVTFLLLIAAVLGRIAFYRRVGVLSTIALSALVVCSLVCWISLRYYDRRRDRIQKLWLTVFSIGLAYAAVDILAGYFLLGQLSPPTIPDSYLHHRLQPHSRSRIVTRDFDYTQTVNTLGVRGPEIIAAKDASTFRILMMGDSFTMGKGVQDDETFSSLLEKSIHAQGVEIRGKTRIEVLNAGVDSYAPILEFLQLKGMATLAPDLVVLNFDMSDLLQESVYRQSAKRGSTGELIGVDWTEDAAAERALPGIDRLRLHVGNWRDEHLYLTSLLAFHLETRLQPLSDTLTVRNVVSRSNPALLRHTLEEDTEDRALQWQGVFESLTSIRDFCRSHSMDFVVAVYPWGHQVNEHEWVPGRTAFLPDTFAVSDRSVLTLEDFGKRNDIGILNVFPAFRAYRGDALLYFRHDPHWTPAGHRVMAEALLQFLTTRYRIGVDG